jgi:hypothetical protein
MSDIILGALVGGGLVLAGIGGAFLMAWIANRI